MEVDWQLSQQCTSDGQGIRAAGIISGDEVDNLHLIAGNQRGGLCAFGVPSGSLHPVDYQHNHAVTALLCTQDGSTYITGCKDSVIRVFKSDLVSTLEGHEKPVTSLAFVSTSTGTQYLVSGSWDGTAKVWDWNRKALIATLPDHENTVCVTGLKSDGLPDGVLRVATGSAGAAENQTITGHTVRIWTINVTTGQVNCTHQVANDHAGPIRDIALVGDNGSIATCSNDGTVRLRATETGESLSTLMFAPEGHPPMLLSVTPIDSSTVAASAEDGNVVVWNLDGGDPQTILHPACVWNVMGLPNGDLVTCCDDGKLRIFTRATDRRAPEAEQEQFAEAVQDAHKKSSGPSPEEVAKLPLWENNVATRGNSEGQVHLFNKGGVAIAAQWSMTSQTWIEVGQVMSSNDGGTIDGASYDHVLPIEVDQTGGGVAKLQIGYNNGENPFVAAQRFIDAHVLPQHHLNEIAEYIRQRVGNETPTLGGGGNDGPKPVATAGIPVATFQHLPVATYKSFELSAKSATTTLDKMKGKIQEFGKLSETQLQQVSALIETLKATNRYHSSTVSSSELVMLSEMLTLFPPAEVFPALDLARLTVAHPDAASINNASYWNKILPQAVSLCGQMDGLEGPAAVAIPLLSLRLFANAFRGGPGSLAAAEALLDEMLKCANRFISSKNKNIRLSVATLLYNLAYYLHTNTSPRPEVAAQVVTSVDAILKAKTYESEAIVRSLVALGTVVLARPEAKQTAQTLFLANLVEMAASPHGDVAKAAAKEVYQVLQ